ncbi:MAG: DUF362 domain-containing protein [Thermodesulfobacteriota bacterium]
MSEEITRRQAVGRLAKLGLTAAVTAGGYGLLYGRSTTEAPAADPGRPTYFKLEDAPGGVVKVVAREAAPAEELVRRALEPLGGLGRFVSRGDVVAVKANMSWDRPPELAANTNPEVISAVVRLCFEAGAARVRLVDHSINDPRRVYLTCGAEAAAKATGAELVYPDSRHFKEMDLGGRRLGRWKVYTPVLEADKLVNLPVAKSHGLCRVTLGLKSWIGAVGGSRGALHQDIHQSIVDLASYFQPTLVIVDAVRIMLRNGPSGGRPSDVAVKNTVLAGTDQVAVDAATLPLFGLSPEEVGYIPLAEQQGLGRIDPGPGGLIEIKL